MDQDAVELGTALRVLCRMLQSQGERGPASEEVRRQRVGNNAVQVIRSSQALTVRKPAVSPKRREATQEATRDWPLEAGLVWCCGVGLHHLYGIERLCYHVSMGPTNQLAATVPPRLGNPFLQPANPHNNGHRRARQPRTYRIRAHSAVLSPCLSLSLLPCHHTATHTPPW